jgi:hypothetical protein
VRQLARAKATVGMGGEHRAKDGRFGTLVHQIYGIQWTRQGLPREGGHTPHGDMELDRTKVMNTVPTTCIRDIFFSTGT